MTSSKSNLNKLLDYEWQEYRELFDAWDKARSEKNWALADSLRDKIHEWQSVSPDKDSFQPMLENHSHTMKRAKERMGRFKIEIYPFTGGYV